MTRLLGAARNRVRRVAIVAREAAGVTGTTTTILEHARRLAAAGWEPHVFGERVDAGRVARAGGQAHVLARWRFGSYLKRRIFAWRFERELRGDELFDLIHGHGDTLRQDLLSLHNCVHAAHEAVHGGPLPRRSGTGRLHAKQLSERRFRLLIANSELMKRELCARFSVPERLIRVIHPGHDPERFKPSDRERLGAPVRAELGLADGEVLVGLITSGDFAKRGVACFLRALAELPPEARGRVRAVVVGRETHLEPFRRLARAGGLGDRVRFLPPDPAVERWYHALDLYAHPALYEEFGQSVQEALACGVPVLTSARVGAAELLGGELRGLLLENPADAAELAAAIARFAASAELRARAGRSGAEAVRANTWDENFRRTLACYEELVAR